MKKIIFTMTLAMALLTACGKEVAKTDLSKKTENGLRFELNPPICPPEQPSLPPPPTGTPPILPPVIDHWYPTCCPANWASIPECMCKDQGPCYDENRILVRNRTSIPKDCGW